MTAPGRSPYEASSPGNRFTRGGWWFFVHLLTFGGLTAVPMAHAASRIRRPWAWAVMAVSIVIGVGCFALVGTAPRDARGEIADSVQSGIGAAGLIVLFLATFGVLAYLRSMAYPSSTDRDGRRGRYGAYDPAIATALANRRRRADARRIVDQDRPMARELRIGRPDLYRTYDDGGLVDLNAVPADVLVRVLAIEPAHAGAIVAARQAAGRFTAVDDVFAWAELPVDLWDHIREHAVVIN